MNIKLHPMIYCISQATSGVEMVNIITKLKDEYNFWV
jgi:hypothetical protein